MRDISHNLEIAKPLFIYFIKNMNWELSQWIQYAGIEEDESSVYFKFKSSDNSLNFTIYAGVKINNIEYFLRGKTNDISNYFADIKDNI